MNSCDNSYTEKTVYQVFFRHLRRALGTVAQEHPRKVSLRKASCKKPCESLISRETDKQQ